MTLSVQKRSGANIIEVTDAVKAKLIVTTCPHCFHTIANEYPQFGGNYVVKHHTEFIDELVREGKLKVSRRNDRAVTYHDPCYLGRHNGEYEAPRKLLQAIPGIELVEMGRNRENGYCCGGGGGGMWMDSFTAKHTKMRLSEKRAMEAASTGANVLAVACPFEVSRFEDAVKSTGNEHVSVNDILELLDRSMRGN